MYHNEGNMTWSIHLQSTYKNHHSVPIEYLSVPYSSMARDISLFHGNANWQVKIWTMLESRRTPSFHRSLQHLTARASVYRDDTASMATVDVLVVQRDRWHSLAPHVRVITWSRMLRCCASWQPTISHYLPAILGESLNPSYENRQRTKSKEQKILQFESVTPDRKLQDSKQTNFCVQKYFGTWYAL
jgi:hypothetical protein